MAVIASSGNALRFMLGSEVWSIPLSSVRRLVGFANLSGDGDEWFLGWLRFEGELVPVFDLGRVVCDAGTPAVFGSRIIIVDATQDETAKLVGLLARDVTDTVRTNEPGVTPLDLGSYLPMLDAMLPPRPTGV